MSLRHSALWALGQACKIPGSAKGFPWACRSTSWAKSDEYKGPSTARHPPAFTRSVDSAAAEELAAESAQENSPESSPETTPASNEYPMSGGSKETPLARAIRINMRAIPHPLALISCNAPSGPAGMLVSSFNTITLSPDPYISFNIKLPSRTYAAISSHGRFDLHALNVTGIWLGQAFLDGKLKRGAQWPGVTKKETLVDHVGVKFTLICEWVREKCVEVGDHVVVVGKVKDAVAGPGARDWGEGLIYSGGKFRTAGKVLDLKSNRPGSGKKVWDK